MTDSVDVAFEGLADLAQHTDQVPEGLEGI